MKENYEISGEVFLEELKQKDVKQIIKKYNLKVKHEELIERAGAGFGQSNDIDIVSFQGSAEGIKKISQKLGFEEEDIEIFPLDKNGDNIKIF